MLGIGRLLVILGGLMVLVSGLVMLIGGPPKPKGNAKPLSPVAARVIGAACLLGGLALVAIALWMD